MPPQNPFDAFTQSSASDHPSVSPTNGENLAHVAAIAFRLEKRCGLSECQGTASRNSSSSEIAWHSSHKKAKFGAFIMSSVKNLQPSIEKLQPSANLTYFPHNAGGLI